MPVDLHSLLVLLIAAIDVLLGAIVFFQDPKDKTNSAFALFSVNVACWGFGVAAYLLFSAPSLVNFFARFLYFMGGAIPATFLYLTLVFNSKMPPSRIKTLFLFLPTLLFVPLYFYTDQVIAGYAFSQIATRPFVYGPLHFLFDLHLWVYFTIAFFVLVNKYRFASGTLRLHILFVLLGTYSVLAVAGVSNVVYPSVLHVVDFIWMGPVATLLWILVTAYAVARHQLFNIRIVVTEVLVFAFILILATRVLFSNGTSEILINTGFLVVVIILGLVLIRNVILEVQARQEVERLARELGETNERQEGLIRFISHEVKGFLTKDMGTFAALVDGDFGILPESAKPLVVQALAQSREGVTSVMDILKASNQKKGTTEYKKEPFDLKALAAEVVEKERPAAEAKGLALSFAAQGNQYQMTGDRAEVGEHVLRNLIENALAYTPSGSIGISLQRVGNHLVFSIKDTGIGISAEDKKRLFTEGGHGKDSQKVNVHSTGYGLFIAKNIVTAHGGTIRAESAGAGKGSTFIVELPA